MASPAVGELDFYRALRRYDISNPATQTALRFARTYAELAQRIIAAQKAQLGLPVVIPPALALPALLAYLEHGPGFSTSQFTYHIPHNWTSASLDLLADLAQWFSTGFESQIPFFNSLQVWVGKTGEKTITMLGAKRALPPPPLVLVTQPPLHAALTENKEHPVALVAHYDVHGIAMLGLSLRTLRAWGLTNIDCAAGFEWTGDISKLWKRAVPKTIAAKHNYGYVVLIDCSVHSRKPKHTLKAITKLNQAPHCHLVIIDHHPDTFFLAPEMQHPQLSLVLTDVPSCGILDQRDHAALEMMLLGALGDKDPESCEAQSATICKQIHEAAAEYHRYAIHFSPTPPKLKEQGIYPLKPLWEALAQGRQVTAALAAETLGALPPEEEMPLPRYAVSGSLVVVTERLNVVGRAWYALLEQLMNKAGVPYAAALRVLDGKRGNVLLLTRWQATHLPPVKHFVPESYLPHCLGHPGALWADLEKASALGFLKSVEQRINTFVGTPGNFNPIAKQLTSEILDESIAM